MLCPICRKNFTVTHHAKIFCNKKCARVDYYRRHKKDILDRSREYRRDNKVILSPRICVECNKEFVPMHSGAGCCSVRCREKRRYKISNDTKNQLFHIIKDFKVKRGCCVCGYNKCHSSLHFHHKDRKTKENTLANFATNFYAKDRIINEMNKCVIVCSNCHGEIHQAERDGVEFVLPETVSVTYEEVFGETSWVRRGRYIKYPA